MAVHWQGWEKAPLHLVGWKGVMLEPGFPHPWNLLWLGPGASCSILLQWRSTCTEPPPKNGLKDAKDAIKLQRKAGLSLQGEDLVGHKLLNCSKKLFQNAGGSPR